MCKLCFTWVWQFGAALGSPLVPDWRQSLSSDTGSPAAWLVQTLNRGRGRGALLERNIWLTQAFTKVAKVFASPELYPGCHLAVWSGWLCAVQNSIVSPSRGLSILWLMLLLCSAALMRWSSSAAATSSKLDNLNNQIKICRKENLPIVQKIELTQPLLPSLSLIWSLESSSICRYLGPETSDKSSFSSRKDVWIYRNVRK